MSSACSKWTLSGQVKKTKKTCYGKKVTGGFGGHWQGLSGKERIWGHFPAFLLAPSWLSARVALGYNNCPQILMWVMEKVVFHVWPPQDSGWEDCDKEHPPIPITSWGFEDLWPQRCLITWQWKFYRVVALSSFPSSLLFCGDLILWNSVLPPGWQEMMKRHGAFHKRSPWEGLTCKGGQARIPEYSLATFSKLSSLDAKSLQRRASQGCFLRSDESARRRHPGTWALFTRGRQHRFLSALLFDAFRSDLALGKVRIGAGRRSLRCSQSAQGVTVDRVASEMHSVKGWHLRTRNMERNLLLMHDPVSIWRWDLTLLFRFARLSSFLLFPFQCPQLNYLHFLLRQILSEKQLPSFPYMPCPNRQVVEILLKFIFQSRTSHLDKRLQEGQKCRSLSTILL